LKLKLIAMKMRHRSHRAIFKRSARALSYQPLLKDRPLCGDVDEPRAVPSSEFGFPLATGSTSSQILCSSPTDRITGSTIHRVHEGSNNFAGLKTIFWHPFTILLVSVPLGYASKSLGWSAMITFWLNFIALVPLAKILGDATEELAAGIHNDTVSGLLNATFGNAVEMIVSVQSIRSGLLSIVKQSLLGSVLSNLLLVLGTAFFAGGLTNTGSDIPHARTYSINAQYLENQVSLEGLRRRLTIFEKEQKFPIKAAQVSLGLLFVACMSFALPTIFSYGSGDNTDAILQVSRLGAFIIGSSYVAFLFFTMITHSRTLQKDERMEDGADTEDDDEEGPGISVMCSILLMVVTTVVITFTSDCLVDAIKSLVGLDGKGGSSKLPAGFIGVILLPIAGNACEHAGAIRFAMQDKPGLAIGIAVGSSTQVALLVVPFSVIVGWAFGQPMNLNFGVMNTVVMLLSVMVVQATIMDGRSNWIKGYMLVATYVFIGVLYWFFPGEEK